MEQSLEQLKKALREITLTSDEKNLLRSRISHFMETYRGAEKIASPFISHPLFIRPLQFVTLILVFVLSGGLGLSYASNDALPGEPLYSFKVNVAEEIISAVKTPVAKADYERERIDNRLDEIATLAIAGKLNEETKEEAQTQIVKQTEKAQKSAQALGVEEPSIELELKAKLEASLASRTQVLLDIKEAKNINGELDDIVATVKATSEDLALEKQVVEARVKKDTGETVKKTVEEKFGDVENKFATLKELRDTEKTAIESKAVLTKSMASTLTVSDDTMVVTSVAITLQKNESDISAAEDSQKTIEITAPEVDSVTPLSWSELNQKVQRIETWYAELSTTLKQGQYGEALVLLQKIEQAIDETLLLVDLKKEFNITAPEENESEDVGSRENPTDEVAENPSLTLLQ